jgi:DNA-binding transcriptional MocR family regulator
MSSNVMPLPVVQFVQRPSIVELGWGHPDPSLLPVEMMRRATEAALSRHGSDALQYGSIPGPGPLLEWLQARIAGQESRAPGTEELMVTAGASWALDAILSVVTDPGDTILVESPTYHLALRILQDRRLRLVPAPADADGLVVEVLEERVAALRREGRRPKALYTIPTFANPTGACLAEGRRRRLIELAAAEGLLILEDDVYRDLAYDGAAPPSLWSMAPPGVVARLGSFSKCLAPGLRLGWLTAGPDLVGQITGGGLLDSCGGINHYTALVVSAVCEGGDLDRQAERLREAYRPRREALCDALRGALPEGCRFEQPGGGFFVWISLPPGVDSEKLLPRAEAEGVSFLPGTRFHIDGGGRESLRLAFTLYPEAELVRAAALLAGAIRSHMRDRRSG